MTMDIMIIPWFITKMKSMMNLVIMIITRMKTMMNTVILIIPRIITINKVDASHKP